MSDPPTGQTPSGALRGGDFDRGTLLSCLENLNKLPGVSNVRIISSDPATFEADIAPGFTVHEILGNIDAEIEKDLGVDNVEVKELKTISFTVTGVPAGLLDTVPSCLEGSNNLWNAHRT